MSTPLSADRHRPGIAEDAVRVVRSIAEGQCQARTPAPPSRGIRGDRGRDERAVAVAVSRLRQESGEKLPKVALGTPVTSRIGVNSLVKGFTPSRFSSTLASCIQRGHQ